ncbi:unnamed protein product [Caretta caretta]
MPTPCSKGNGVAQFSTFLVNWKAQRWNVGAQLRCSVLKIQGKERLESYIWEGNKRVASERTTIKTIFCCCFRLQSKTKVLQKGLAYGSISSAVFLHSNVIPLSSMEFLLIYVAISKRRIKL